MEKQDKIIEVKIDKSSFNATHFAGFSEDQFIEHELTSVPDSYGSEENKKAFLKSAFAEIQKVAGKKPVDNEEAVEEKLTEE